MTRVFGLFGGGGGFLRTKNGMEDADFVLHSKGDIKSGAEAAWKDA